MLRPDNSLQSSLAKRSEIWLSKLRRRRTVRTLKSVHIISIRQPSLIHSLIHSPVNVTIRMQRLRNSLASKLRVYISEYLFPQLLWYVLLEYL